MKTATILQSILVSAVVVSLSACVTHRTVTRGGKTVKSGYVVKRPFKETL